MLFSQNLLHIFCIEALQRFILYLLFVYLYDSGLNDANADIVSTQMPKFCALYDVLKNLLLNIS